MKMIIYLLRKILCLTLNRKSNIIEEKSKVDSDPQNKSITNYSRRNSITKSSKIKLQKQPSEKVKDLAQKQTNQVIYGMAALEMKKEKIRKRKELKRQQEELRIKEEQDKIQEKEKQKEQDEKNLKIKRLFQLHLDKIHNQLDEANKDMKEIEDYNRNNSEEFLMDQMRGSDGFSVKEEEENKKLRELRKDLLRRDSIDEALLSKMDTIAPPKSIAGQVRLTVPKLIKNDSVSSKENNQELNKIAHEITDVHIEKEKFFQIVKEVLSGSLLNKVIEVTNEKENDESNKYSKK